MSQGPSAPVGSRTAQGMAWAYGSYVGGKLLVLASTAILARLLTPDEFGVVGFALTFMALLEGVANLGLSQALVIQDDEVVHDRAETVLVSSIALGAAFSVLTVAASPLVASFFDNGDLVAITSVLGLNFFLNSLGITHYALAQREIDFRARTIAEVAGVIARGATGVALALSGFGVWSLVIGYLVGTIALDVAIWLLVPWRPRLAPRRSHLGKLLRFGGTLSAVDVVATFIANIDYVFIGRVLGAAPLGLYTLAFRLPGLAIINMSTVAGRVLFPAFSAFRKGRLERAYLIAVRYTWIIALPLAVGLALLAEPFILALFGDQWEEAVAPMQVLTIFAFAVTVGIPAGTAYKATGRAGVLLKLGLARLALLAAGLAIFVDQGLVAAAACQAAVAGLAAVVGILLASRLLAVPLRRIGAAAWPAIAASAVMVAPVYWIERAIDEPVLALAAGVLVGAAAYLAALLAIAPDVPRYLWGKLRGPRPPTGGEPEEPAEKVRATRETDVIA